MLRSMTGYGRGEVIRDGYSCVVEVRSVNHRFLDISIKLPKRFTLLESRIRQTVQKRFSRGRFDITLSWQNFKEGERALQIDRGLARQYILALQELKEEFGLAGPVRTDVLTAFKDIFQLMEREEDLEEVGEALAEGLDCALDSLECMREVEGQVLGEDIRGRIEEIDRHIQVVKARYPMVLAEYQERLREKVRGLVGELEIDPQRLAQEVALLADRSDITEELARLESHLKQFFPLLQEESPVGRTLEFLLQEIHREVNTLGSKANDFIVSQRAVAIKAELEKIREQVQNIE